jgi:hypothetical protein
MYIEVVPNRDSNPCILLRESYRQDGKVCKRTLANLSKLPAEAIEGLRSLLRGGTFVAPLLFDDEDPAAGESLRASVVAPAQQSPSAQRKACTLRTADGLTVHGFATLLRDLATLTKNRARSAPFPAPP